MLSWYCDENINIKFNNVPQISIRYVLPTMSSEEKKSIKKYPFINKMELQVFIEDLNKKKKYSFIIPKGYCFDGATVPRFFWRLIGSNTDNKFLVAAMIHDYICENHASIDSDRALSTVIFDALLLVGGVGSCKRFFMKHSVNIFQKFFCGW